MGPRGQAVIDQLLATVTELETCEHGCGDCAFWIAARPGLVLCGFCYQAAQVLATDLRCAACGQPAGDPGTDAVVVARVAPPSLRKTGLPAVDAFRSRRRSNVRGEVRCDRGGLVQHHVRQ
jgi:hypothetical protein